MALDAAEQAQIKTLADELGKFRRIVYGAPPNHEGLQRQATRMDRQLQRLLRVVDGDAEIRHVGLQGQLAELSARMARMEEQLKAMIDAKEAEAHQREGMLKAFRFAGGLLGSSLLLQVAQLLGLIHP